MDKIARLPTPGEQSVCLTKEHKCIADQSGKKTDEKIVSLDGDTPAEPKAILQNLLYKELGSLADQNTPHSFDHYFEFNASEFLGLEASRRARVSRAARRRRLSKIFGCGCSSGSVDLAAMATITE